MDRRKSLCQLIQVTGWILVLTRGVVNEDPQRESTEIIGNYTVRIKINQSGGISASGESYINYKVFGEKYLGTPAEARAHCRDANIQFTDIADIGRICSISLRKSPSDRVCSIDKVIIIDNNRNEEAVFNVKTILRDSENTYQRSEPLQLSWEKWGAWSSCNCSEFFKSRTRTCPSVSADCSNVIPCKGKPKESISCACGPPAETGTGSAGGDQSVIIPIIASIGAILVIIVVAAICYSRRLTTQKKGIGAGRYENYPEIIITPPEESENSTLSSTNPIGQQSKLIAAGDYVTNGVRKQNQDMEWENNDLYVSASP